MKSIEKMKKVKDVEGLIIALKDRSNDVKKKAAMALGAIGDERAIQPLIQALKNDSLTVVLDVKTAIAQLGKLAVERLILAMKDKYARWGAIHALGDIGDARALTYLVEALRDLDPMNRGAAAIALGKIGNSEAVEPLIRALKDEDGVIIRELVIESLGKIGDLRAIGPLTKVLQDKKEGLHKAAKKALVNIKRKLGDVD